MDTALARPNDTVRKSQGAYAHALDEADPGGEESVKAKVAHKQIMPTKEEVEGQI